MRIFTIKYEKNAVKNAIRGMDESIKSGKPHIRKDQLICGDFDTFMGMISQKGKFETFEGIIVYRPGSLYELAKIMGKDQSQLLKEARSLEAIGLIKLQLVKEGKRERLKPEPLYDKIVFEMEPKRLPKIA